MVFSRARRAHRLSRRHHSIASLAMFHSDRFAVSGVRRGDVLRECRESTFARVDTRGYHRYRTRTFRTSTEVLDDTVGLENLHRDRDCRDRRLWMDLLCELVRRHRAHVHLFLPGLLRVPARVPLLVWLRKHRRARRFVRVDANQRREVRDRDRDREVHEHPSIQPRGATEWPAWPA